MRNQDRVRGGVRPDPAAPVCCVPGPAFGLSFAGSVGRMAIPQDSDWSWLRAAAEAPEMTLELYEASQPQPKY